VDDRAVTDGNGVTVCAETLTASAQRWGRAPQRPNLTAWNL